MGIEVIGWVSSFILLLTIGKQVFKQWKEGSTKGVSHWLFIGQLAASIGFTIYSVGVKSWVFVVTNSLMTVSAVLGLVIFYRAQRREGSP